MNGASWESEANQWLSAHEARVRPLEKQANLAWWVASISGSDADFAKQEAASNALDAVFSDKGAFTALKDLKDRAPEKGAALQKRQIEVLYRSYLEKQLDPTLIKKINALKADVEKTFNRYRARVGGRELSPSDVDKIMDTSTDSKQRQAVWEASKGVGTQVEKNLIELVELRNKAARDVGFKNFHELQLYLAEQTPAEISAIFDELDALTTDAFNSTKDEMDAVLAKRFKISPKDLMPWHYDDLFFQKPPDVYGNLRTETLGKADILAVNRQFYAGIGLPIDDVIARSDLYEKKGKSPHAFCTDIDREGDVRVLANVVPSDRWMTTMLHELGHSLYSSKYIPRSVPYLLRQASHTLTTEGFAMLMEEFSDSADWLTKLGVRVAKPEGFTLTSQKMRRATLLVFARWCQVVYRFEKGLYENPKQNLNRLWWRLVSKYQGIRAPSGRNSPDYASKIHIVTVPVYYHNYMLGQLFASQVMHALAREVFKEEDISKISVVGRKDVGKFFRERVFEPGATMDWRELTEHATGEPLASKAFASDFQVKKPQ